MYVFLCVRAFVTYLYIHCKDDKINCNVFKDSWLVFLCMHAYERKRNTFVTVIYVFTINIYSAKMITTKRKKSHMS